MNAVLLCPGPSLVNYPGGGELVLGVNRAATIHRCDVWVCCDWIYEGTASTTNGGVKYLRDQVIGSPTLVIGSDGHSSLKRHNIYWPNVVEVESWWGDYDPHGMGWTLYSATTALMYAHHRGAKTIDVYGVDWSGTKDWDGTPAGGTRTDARWESERGIWKRLTGYLEQRGTKVKRYGSVG